MMLKNDKKLSLDENTFENMKNDFDSILNTTIGNMEMKGAPEATITLKLSISLEKATTYNDNDRPVDVTRPVFKHDISSVMQVKDKKSGQLNEDMALVFDEQLGEYVLRPIKNGQMSFDDVMDAEYTDKQNGNVKAIDMAKLPPTEDDIPDEEDDSEDVDDEDIDEEPFGDDKESDDSDEEDAPDKNESRYDWLVQFVDEDLTVVEEDGGYKVKTADGETVLSSLVDKNDPAFVNGFLLKDLVGQSVECVEYEEDGKTVSVAVECSAKNALIAEASTPDFEE